MKGPHKRLVAALEAHLAGAPMRLPEGAEPLWRAFCDLSRARPSGPGPIAFSEIAAWSALMRCPLEPHHVETIRALDDAWLKSAHRMAPGGKGGASQPPSAPLTPEIFDTFFG